MPDDKIRGSILLEFSENHPVPKVIFTGSLKPTDIQPGVIALRKEFRLTYMRTMAKQEEENATARLAEIAKEKEEAEKQAKIEAKRAAEEKAKREALDEQARKTAQEKLNEEFAKNYDAADSEQLNNIRNHMNLVMGKDTTPKRIKESRNVDDKGRTARSS